MNYHKLLYTRNLKVELNKFFKIREKIGNAFLTYLKPLFLPLAAAFNFIRNMNKNNFYFLIVSFFLLGNWKKLFAIISNEAGKCAKVYYFPSD